MQFQQRIREILVRRNCWNKKHVLFWITRSWNSQSTKLRYFMCFCWSRWEKKWSWRTLDSIQNRMEFETIESNRNEETFYWAGMNCIEELYILTRFFYTHIFVFRFLLYDVFIRYVYASIWRSMEHYGHTMSFMELVLISKMLEGGQIFVQMMFNTLTTLVSLMVWRRLNSKGKWFKHLIITWNLFEKTRQSVECMKSTY